MMRLIRRGVFALVILGAVIAGVGYWLLRSGSVLGAFERQASAWLGQPVHIASASMRFFPKPAIELRDIRVGDPARMALAQVRVAADLRALLSRRLEHAEIVVVRSHISLPLPFSFPVAASTTEPKEGHAADGEATASGAFSIASIDTISLDNIVVTGRGRDLTLSARSSLVGDRLTISMFEAHTNSTSIQASGTVTLAPKLTAVLDAKSNDLDLDDLLALVSAFTPTTDSNRGSPTTTGRLSMKLSATHARVAGLSVERLVTNIETTGQRVVLKPLQCQVLGGRLDGALEAELDDDLTITARVDVTNLDMAALAEFGGSPGIITGRFSGSSRFVARGRDLQLAVAAARGSGQATIDDGTLRGLQIVPEVVRFFGRPSPDSRGGSERFDDISATFQLADRTLRSDDLTLRSQEYDVRARGTLALPTRALSARADVLLSEMLSAEAGRDLYRYTREGNRILLPASISGALGAPRVRIDAGSAVKRGLRNEAERRLGDLLDRFSPRQKKPPQP